MNDKIDKEKPITKIYAQIFGQVNMKPSEELSTHFAYSALYPIHDNKQYIRQSKNVVFKIYPSKLVLKNLSWFKNEKKKVLYIHSILKYFVFKSMKRFLVIGVEQNAYSRCLIILKISAMEKLLLICDTVERQHGLTFESPKDEVQVSDTTVSNEVPRYFNNEIHVPSVMTETRYVQTDTPRELVRHSMKYEESPRPPSNHGIRYDGSPRQHGIHSARYDERPKQPTNIGIRYDGSPKPLGMHSMRYDDEPLDRIFLKNEPKWQEDVKFISYNSKYGNFVDDGGSVFMYTAQQISPYNYSHNTNFYAASSSGNSSDQEYDGYRMPRPKRY